MLIFGLHHVNVSSSIRVINLKDFLMAAYADTNKLHVDIQRQNIISGFLPSSR